MPLPADDIVRLAKVGLWTVLEDTVTDIDVVKPDEQTRWTDESIISIFTDGYMRAPVASPFVEGDKIVDPLGGRAWLLLFKVRLFLDLKADGDAAQLKADILLPKIVRAVEQNPTLGTASGPVDEPKIIEAALPTGRLAKIDPTGASNTRELLMLEMDAQVHLIEPDDIS